jgi:succinyl-CoA synthetase beta subunit
VRVADEPTGKALLVALGIGVPEARVVASPDDAPAAAAAIGWPVAVKRVATDVPHKSDAGGVEGPLHTADEVRGAAARVWSQGAAGVLVEHWEDGGVACFAGLTIGGPFGAVVSFGLGGIWVEVLRDVAHRLAPIDDDEAVEMMLTIRGAPILTGARGRSPVALASLASALSRLSQLGIDRYAARVLTELDINPLLARVNGPPIALDAAVTLADPPTNSTR